MITQPAKSSKNKYMKIIIYISSSILIVLTFFACNTTKYTIEELPDQQLYFGSGGGFTGAVNEYMLLDNGQLYKHDGGEYTEVPKVKKKKAEKLFKTYYDLKLDSLQFRRPGNMYYYLRMKDKEEEFFTSWGNPAVLPDSAIGVLYDDLMGLVRKVK